MSTINVDFETDKAGIQSQLSDGIRELLSVGFYGIQNAKQ